MTTETPVAELAKRFSSPNAGPRDWAEALGRLAKADVYWLSTVRPDGRPHVTPLIAVWLDGALHFCTGADERKGENLARNPHVVVTTGCNALGEGLDLVVEGDAVRVSDDAGLQGLADAYVSKYGEDWRFTVRDGAFLTPDGGEALVYAVAPQHGFRLRQRRDVQPDALAVLAEGGGNPMRKLSVNTFLTLDGVMQAPGGPGEDPSGGFTHEGWSVNYWDEGMGQIMDESISRPFEVLSAGRPTRSSPRTGPTSQTTRWRTA